MFLFLKLYLAHLLGDFVFQFDELYKLKIRSRWGHFFHVLFHLVLMVLLVFPYLKHTSITLFILGIAIIHYFQDIVKYKLQAKLKKTFLSFVIDQFFHTLWIGLVFFLPESKQVVEFISFPTLNSYYISETLTKVTMLVLCVTFVSAYLLHNFKKSYFRDARVDHFVTSAEMSHNFIERLFVSLTIILSPSIWLIALTPII